MIDSTNPRVIMDQLKAVNKRVDKVASSGDYQAGEVATGKKWIDGKEIYQKTIILDNTSSDEIILMTSDDFDTLIKVSAFAYAGVKTSFDIVENPSQITTYMSNGDLICSITGIMMEEILSGHIIVEYTKPDATVAKTKTTQATKKKTTKKESD